jgi:predicted nucleotide-binding protein
MFFVGRQLGLIATGFFRFWIVKHLLGQFMTFFYWGWQRRCHLTADRLGLLVAGDVYAAEQALIIITAGSGIAANTNLDAVRQQRSELMSSTWAWIQLSFSSYPYLVDRIIRIREFANEAAMKGLQANSPVAVAALPINHRPIRALPVMIIHGHDAGSRLELENFLLRQFPHVALITMINEADAAYTLPEKFERLAGKVKGAIALLTPDDAAVALQNRSSNLRARQNVIIEIGWVWGRFGRNRCLLLTRGNVEMPSDLSGVETHRFQRSPVECSERLRDFIAELAIR